MVIAGSDKATRRRAPRRQRPGEAPRFGDVLRQAREALGLGLDVVQDRTGVRQADIAALEASDLSGFPDEKSARLAVRRCAEVVGLDATPLLQVVGDHWLSVGAGTSFSGLLVTTGPAPGAATAGPPTTAATGAVPVFPPPTAHLSRYPGDSTDLRAFTQTAPVPVVTSRRSAPTLPPGLRFDTTDAHPATVRVAGGPDFTPLPLRVAVWSALLLVFLGVVGISIHHYRPSWLAPLHLAGSSAPPASAAGGRHPATTRPVPAAATVPTGARSATVSVHSPVYDVVVTTTAACWIHVTVPTSSAPLFSATVPGGTTKTFGSGAGQLSLELGSSHATVTVQVLGKTVPGWSLIPASAPYTVAFHGTNG